jgi:hypothetical protein
MRKIAPALFGLPLTASHHGVKVSAIEAATIRLWIDSGAAYPGTYASLGSGMIGGYYENQMVNADFDWPATRAAAAVMARRCDSCHKPPMRLPHALSDEVQLSFWQPDPQDPQIKSSRHFLFNLSRPELSLIVLAPLSPKAGGLGMCKRDPKTGLIEKQIAVFDSSDDPDYRALLAMMRAGKAHLEEIGRFDMPNFRPPQPYVREMRRYGILPATIKPGDKVDYYAADRAYWKSFWWEPKD